VILDFIWISDFGFGISSFVLYRGTRFFYSDDVHQTQPAWWEAVLWLGVNAAIPAAGLGTAGGARPPWPPPASIFSAYVAALLVFLVFLWPLGIPRAVRAAASAGPRPRPGRVMAGQLVCFAALGAPFGLLCARLAGLGLGPALRALAVLAAATACVAAAFLVAWERPRRAVLYQLATWTLCAAAPFLYYLGREWTGADWAWLAAVSPFRGVADPDAATGWGSLWIVQTGGYGLLAIALAGVARLKVVRAPAS
jgi:hypothetical protein